MKKIIKNRVFLVIITAIICVTGSVYASQILARDIAYKNTNVEDALDDLYAKAPKKICELKSGTANSIGAKYDCEVGENIHKDFYILEIRDKEVDLIMDRNITQGTSTTTMTWNNAMKYIENNNLKSTWTNVLNIDLPKAQAIANAVGRSNWIAADSEATWWCLATGVQDYPNSDPYCNTQQASTYNWLYDYTRECNGCSHSLGSTEAYGYYTRDLISNTDRVWIVTRLGTLHDFPISVSTNYGVRPVITVLKSQLN